MPRWFREIASLFRACVRSRLGWLLAAVHALWLDLGIRSMGPPSRAAANLLDSLQGSDWTLFAGRPFHFTYQSWVLKSVLLVDLPAMLVASLADPLSWPVSFVTHVGRYEGSNIAAGLLFVVATGQWLMVGCVLERRFRTKTQPTRSDCVCNYAQVVSSSLCNWRSSVGAFIGTPTVRPSRASRVSIHSIWL